MTNPKKSNNYKTNNKTKKIKKLRHRDFREFVLEQLKDPELALGYLNECLKADDQRVFLVALKNVLEAHGSNINFRSSLR